jgi:hypothetical protein
MAGVIAALAAYEALFFELQQKFIDALVRYANQGTNNYQNVTDSLAINTDGAAGTRTAVNIAQRRINNSMQIMPSRTTCVAGTHAKDSIYAVYGGSGFGGTNAAIRAAETAINNTWSNASGTIGERGRLAFQNTRYADRITRYNNQDGTGLAVTPTVGKDRDLLPYESIFKMENLAAANDYQAGKDVVFNLQGDVVLDPVRGAVLSRADGQNLSVTNYSDQTKLNLAGSVLMGLVERRRSTGGYKTEQALQNGSSYTTLALQALAKAQAGETKGQNLDEVSQMIGDSNRQIFMLYYFFEQMAAIQATSLAMDVKGSSAELSGLAQRLIQAN